MTPAVFETCYLIGLVAGSVTRAIYTRPYKHRKIVRDQKSPSDMILVTLASLGLLFIPLVYLLTSWLDFANYASFPQSVLIAAGCSGIAVFTLAIWLLWRSHVDLGRNWSPYLEIREEQTLVTRGVYRNVRHPMYLAHLLWAIAQILLLHNWIAGWSFLIVFLPMYLLRVPDEEQMMLEQFGDDYQQYMQRTGRLFPRFLSR